MPYKAGGTADIDIPSRNVFMTFRDFFGFRGGGVAKSLREGDGRWECAGDGSGKNNRLC